MRRVISLVVALLCEATLFAQSFTPQNYAGVRYQQMQVVASEQKKPALVVYLHGGSGRGEDGESHMRARAIWSIAEYLQANKIASYFVVPQCLSTHEWAGNWGVEGYNDKVLELISHYIADKGIDESRIYICGVSMGGWGIWDLLSIKTNLFAAAFIASAHPKEADARKCARTPICLTVGEYERTAERLRDFTIEIKQAGGEIKFSELVGLEHRDACSRAFTTDRLKWLFSHKRTNK